jgi:predicted acetyltransferase
MQLVLPSAEYKDSYIAAVKEHQSDTSESLRARAYKKRSVEELEADFESFVAKERGFARGENLPEGWVPHTTLWLVDDGRYIGTVDIRHNLTKSLEDYGGHIGYDIRPSERGKGYGSTILALALPKARELGITRVRIMCDENNTASRKVIEKNGGVFEDKGVNPENGIATLRFWIEN